MRLAAIAMSVGLFGCAGGIDDNTDTSPPNADPLSGCALACHGTKSW